MNLYFILIFPFSYWGKVLFLGNFSNHISSSVCILCCSFRLRHGFFLFVFSLPGKYFFLSLCVVPFCLDMRSYGCVYSQKYFFLLNKIHKISVYLKDLVFNLCNVTGALGWFNSSFEESRRHKCMYKHIQIYVHHIQKGHCRDEYAASIRILLGLGK